MYPAENKANSIDELSPVIPSNESTSAPAPLTPPSDTVTNNSAPPNLEPNNQRDFYVDPIPLKFKIDQLEAKNAQESKVEAENAKRQFERLPFPFVLAIRKLSALHQDLGDRVESVAEKVDQFVVWEHYGAATIVLTAFVSSKLISYFNLGWIAYVLASWYLSWLYKMNIDRLRRKTRALTIREKSIGFNDSDVETLEWFNGFVERLWNNFEHDVSEIIKDHVTTVLDGLSVPGFDEIRLSKFTLGSQAPRIEGIKNFASTGDDTFVLDFDLLFYPYDEESVSSREKRLKELRNFEVVIEAILLKVPLPIALKEIFFNGQLRVQFQFTKVSPYIRMVEIGFINSPTMDFVLKPIGTDITKVAMLGSMIKDVVKQQVDALIVNPMKMTFDIDEMMNGDGGRTEIPAGVLRVIFYEAQGLKNIDLSGLSFSNPAILIKMGGEEVARTHVFDNSCDPTWNYIHHIILNHGVLEQGADVTFEVVNVSPLGSLTTLGTIATFPLSKWLRCTGMDVCEDGPLTVAEKEELIVDWGSPFEVNGVLWKDVVIGNSKHGKVRLDLSFYPVLPDSGSSLPPPADVATIVPGEPVSSPSKTNMDITTPPASPPPAISIEIPPVSSTGRDPILQSPVADTSSPSQMVPGVVIIALNQAKELSKGRNGAIQCIGRVGGKEVVKSAIRKRTINPSWGSKHFFYCPDIESAFINFGVLNKGNLIGECKVNLNKAKDSKDSWYSLVGGSGKLSVDVKFMSLDCMHSSLDPAFKFRFDPIGLLRVRLIEAEDLQMGTMDTLSMGLTNLNPYCKIHLQDRSIGLSKTQEKVSKPRWNETFQAVSYSHQEVINFEVFDESSFSKDKYLGHFEISLKDLMQVEQGLVDPVASEEGEESKVQMYIKHGLKVSRHSNGKYEVWAPLYSKLDHVEEEGAVQEDVEDDAFKKERRENKGGAFNMIKKVNLQNLKGGLTTLASTTVNVIGQTTKLALDPLSLLNETQKGSIHFEFDIMNVKGDSVVDSIPLVQSSSPVDDGENSGAIEKELANKPGVLRMRIESAALAKKCRPFVELVCDDAQRIIVPPLQEKLFSTFWHASQDLFFSNLVEYSGLKIVVKDEDDEDVMFHWAGDFLQDIVGKGPITLALNSNEESASIQVSATFFPIECGKILESSDSGILHVDIVECKDIPPPYPTCFIRSSLNGDELLKTKSIRKTGHPEFEEGFQIPIHSRISSNVLLELFEKKMTHEVLMGSANLALENVISGQPCMVTLPLSFCSGATVTLRYLFQPQHLSSLPPIQKRVLQAKDTNAIGKLGKGMLDSLVKVGDVVAIGAAEPQLAGFEKRESSLRNCKNLSVQTLVDEGEQTPAQPAALAPRSPSIKSNKSAFSTTGFKKFGFSLKRRSK